MHICCFSEPWQRPYPPGRWTAAAPAPRSPTAGVRHALAPIPSAPRWRLPHGSCVLQLLPAPPPALHDRYKYRTPPRRRPSYAPFSTHITRCSRPDNNSSKFLATSTLQTYIFVYFVRVHVQFSLLAGCCSDSMFQRTSQPSLLPPCHSWPLQQYLTIPCPGIKPDCGSRWAPPFLRFVNVGKPNQYSYFINLAV